MGGLACSTPACYGSTLQFEFRHPSKIINWRHNQRSGKQTLARQKNIQKINFLNLWNSLALKYVGCKEAHHFVLYVWSVSLIDTPKLTYFSNAVFSCFSVKAICSVSNGKGFSKNSRRNVTSDCLH
jgi:hypothetical protein